MGNDIDEDALVDAKLRRRRDRNVRHEMRGRDFVGDGIDRNMGNIKITIPHSKE